MVAVRARAATSQDLPQLVRLYAGLEAEMVGLKPIWAVTDGLAQPVEWAFEELMQGTETGIVIGELESAPVGFLAWRHSALLPQAGGTRIGVIDLIFTEADARRVGIGEAMINAFLSTTRNSGIGLFDAIVPPGHRHAKNFFESHGFKARCIVMHSADAGDSDEH